MGNSLYLTENLKVFLRIERRVDKNLFDINNASVIKYIYGVSDASTFRERNREVGVNERKPLWLYPRYSRRFFLGCKGLFLFPIQSLEFILCFIT